MPSKRESIVACVLGMYATRAAPRMRMRNFDYLPHGMTVRMLWRNYNDCDTCRVAEGKKFTLSYFRRVFRNDLGFRFKFRKC